MLKWAWNVESRWSCIGNKFKFTVYCPQSFPRIQNIRYIPETNQIELIGYFVDGEKNIGSKYNDEPCPESPSDVSRQSCDGRGSREIQPSKSDEYVPLQ